MPFGARCASPLWNASNERHLFFMGGHLGRRRNTGAFRRRAGHFGGGVNTSNILHGALGLALMGLGLLVGYLAGVEWTAALCGSCAFIMREMRDSQRERQFAGIGHRNKLIWQDLLPGTVPYKLDTILDWAVPTALCVFTASVIETLT